MDAFPCSLPAEDGRARRGVLGRFAVLFTGIFDATFFSAPSGRTILLLDTAGWLGPPAIAFAAGIAVGSTLGFGAASIGVPVSGMVALAGPLSVSVPALYSVTAAASVTGTECDVAGEGTSVSVFVG